VAQLQVDAAVPGPEGWAVHTDEGERQFLSPAGDELAVTLATVIAATVDRLTRTFGQQ
jgi:hypothetical protein